MILCAQDFAFIYFWAWVSRSIRTKCTVVGQIMSSQNGRRLRKSRHHLNRQASSRKFDIPTNNPFYKIVKRKQIFFILVSDLKTYENNFLRYPELIFKYFKCFKRQWCQFIWKHDGRSVYKGKKRPHLFVMQVSLDQMIIYLLITLKRTITK